MLEKQASIVFPKLGKINNLLLFKKGKLPNNDEITLTTQKYGGFLKKKLKSRAFL